MLNCGEDEFGKYNIINDSKVYFNPEVPLYIILHVNYHPILKNMIQEEFYIIQDKFYDIISEIKYNNKIVGFTACNFYNKSLIVELGYILPKYRNKGLLAKELVKLKYINNDLWLDLPNRFAIESLLNNGFAVKVNEFIVKSNILLSFRHPYKEHIRLSTCFYDLRICACVDLVNNFISPLLDVDIYCFNGDRTRDKLINNNYFKEFSLYI